MGELAPMRPSGLRRYSQFNAIVDKLVGRYVTVEKKELDIGRGTLTLKGVSVRCVIFHLFRIGEVHLKTSRQNMFLMSFNKRYETKFRLYEVQTT